MAETYAEKYKHPNWQRKRLEIMNRADFTCEACGSTNNSLQVHHGYYERGMDPWDYDDDTLHCFCVDCHLKADELKRRLHKRIATLSPMRLRLLSARLGVNGAEAS